MMLTLQIVLLTAEMAKKQEIKKQHENTQKAWETKKQEWQNQQKASQAESEKNKKVGRYDSG